MLRSRIIQTDLVGCAGQRRAAHWVEWPGGGGGGGGGGRPGPRGGSGGPDPRRVSRDAGSRNVRPRRRLGAGGPPGRSAFPAGVTGPPRALSGARLSRPRSDVRSAEPGAAAAPLPRPGKCGLRAPVPAGSDARRLARSASHSKLFFYLSFNWLLFLRMNDRSLLS